MVWFTLALFLVNFLLAQVLTPKPKQENSRPQGLDAGSIPKADSGVPIPYIFGRVRLRAPNVLWYGNFFSLANSKKVKTGIFSSENIITSYNYHIGLHLGLCLGPGVKLYRVYSDKKLLFSEPAGISGGSSFVINKPSCYGGVSAGGGFTSTVDFYGGETSQSQNAYLAANVDPNVPAYVGISYLVFESAYIGTSPSLRPINVEISRYPNNLGLADSKIGEDLNPMEILYSILTEKWGGVNLAASSIDLASFTAAAATLLAESHGMSLILSTAQQAKDAISEVLRQVDGLLYQDPETGKITVKLVREDYVVSSLPLFDPSNVEEIVTWSRTGWQETTNQVRVQFTDRDRLYATSTAFAQDMANIAVQARIRSASLSFPACTEGAVALTLATRELSQMSVPLYQATVKANRNATVLRPGSVFRLTWPDYGLTDVVMRVQRYDLGELVQGHIVMDCLQDKFSAANPLFADPETSLWQPLDRTAPELTESNVFEAPYYVVDQADVYPFLYLSESGTFQFKPDSSWLIGFARAPLSSFVQGYDLRTSYDSFVADSTYDLERVPVPRSFKLVDAVGYWQGMENGLLTRFKVGSLQPPDWVPTAASSSFIKSRGYNLAVIEGEFFAWESVTNNGDGTWMLNNVRRALLDSQFQSHVVNSVAFLLDASNWLSKNPHADTDTFDYRLLSFTDSDEKDLSTVASTPITMQQRYDSPYPPDYLEISSVRPLNEMIGQTSISLAWRHRNRKIKEVPLYNDVSQSMTTETVSYTARFYVDGILYKENTAISGATTTLTPPAGLVGEGEVRVLAVRAALPSLWPDYLKFWWGAYPSLSAELVANPNFEGSLTGWTTISGTWNYETTAFPLNAFRSLPGYTTNTRHLRATASSSEIQQDVTIGAQSGRAALLSLYKGGKVADITGQAIIELRDASTALQTITTTLEAATVGVWERMEIPLPLRTDALTVRIRIKGTAAESVWDQVSLKANTVSTNTPFSYNLLTAVSALGAWGLRKMISTYAGALVRIRDTATDVEQDVGFDTDGNLAPYWVKGEARVVKIYDQTGSGSHLTAPSAATQPKLLAMLSETGRPGIKFFSGNLLVDTLPAATSGTYRVTRPNAALAIGPQVTTNNAMMATIPQDDTVHTTPFYRWGMTMNSGADWRYQYNGSQSTISAAPTPVTGKHGWFWDYQNGALYHNDDVTPPAGGTFSAVDITYPVATRLRIGKTPGTGTLPWDGYLFEFCIFSGNIAAAERKTILEGLGTYWFNAAY